MPARTQEMIIGIGFHKQTGTGLTTTTKAQLQTALAAGDLWNLGINAFNTPFPSFNKESDAEFFGKGHEWVTQVFPTSIDVGWEWPFHLTSQNWAMALAFALGTVIETPPDTGAYQYVATPLDPIVDGVNLPATTIVLGIRQGTAGEIIDTAVVGVVCDGFTLRVQRGPGLQNSQLISRWIGSGKYVDDSGIAIPSRTVEARIGAGGGANPTISINGVDYASNARFVSMEFVYNNNSAPGYFPGSGSQNQFDIGGRMRCGRRTAQLTWQVELEAGSAELADLLNATEGSVDILLQGALIAGSTYHTARLQFPRTLNRTFALQDADGFVSAQVITDILFDDSDGPMTLTAITDKTEIGADA